MIIMVLQLFFTYVLHLFYTYLYGFLRLIIVSTSGWPPGLA